MSGPFALKYLHLFLRDHWPEHSSVLGTEDPRTLSVPTPLTWRKESAGLPGIPTIDIFGLSTPPRPTMRTISSTIGTIAIVRLITLFLPCRGSALIGDVPLRDVPPAP